MAESDIAMNLVDAILSETEGHTPKQIHAKLDGYAIGTIKNCLNNLNDEGRVRIEGQPPKRVYFKAPGLEPRFTSTRRTRSMTEAHAAGAQ